MVRNMHGLLKIPRCDLLYKQENRRFIVVALHVSCRSKMPPTCEAGFFSISDCLTRLKRDKKKRRLLIFSWLKCPVRVGRVMMTLDKSGNVPTVAGAFTPLWSAEGGFPGPAFMPGFRRDRTPNRASPKATIPAAFCRARNHRRIDSASSLGPLDGHAVPRPSSNGVWSSTRAQARA